MNLNEAGRLTEADKALQEALDNAPKSKLSEEMTQKILCQPKGDRLDPYLYLSKDYIEAHYKLFDDGAIKIQKFSPSDLFNSGKIGNPEDKVTFVIPKEIGKKVIDASDGDPRKLEELLGLHSGDLGKNPAIINIDYPKNVHIPSGNEKSAFPEYWHPGGYTYPGKIPEAVIDEVPKGDYTWHSLN